MCYKKETKQIPRPGRRLPALVSFEYFSCIKIKFLKARIPGQKTHEKRSFHFVPLSLTYNLSSHSNRDDAPLAKTEASFRNFGSDFKRSVLFFDSHICVKIETF